MGASHTRRGDFDFEDDTRHAAINRGNAQALIPRLAT